MSSNIAANNKATCDFFRIFLQTLVGRVIERLKWGSETSLRRFVVKRPKRQQNYNGQEAGGGRAAQKICTIESETWILPGNISFKRPLQNSEALEFSVHAIHSNLCQQVSKIETNRILGMLHVCGCRSILAQLALFFLSSQSSNF